MLPDSSKSASDIVGAVQKANTTPIWHQYTNKGLKSYQVNREYPLIKQLLESLDSSQSGQLNELIRLVEQSFPIDQLYVDYANSPTEFKTKHTDEELESLAISYLDNFSDMQLDLSIIAGFFELTEPYSNYKGNWNLFLEKIEAKL